MYYLERQTFLFPSISLVRHERTSTAVTAIGSYGDYLQTLGFFSPPRPPPTTSSSYSYTTNYFLQEPNDYDAEGGGHHSAHQATSFSREDGSNVVLPVKMEAQHTEERIRGKGKAKPPADYVDYDYVDSPMVSTPDALTRLLPGWYDAWHLEQRLLGVSPVFRIPSVKRAAV